MYVAYRHQQSLSRCIARQEVCVQLNSYMQAIRLLKLTRSGPFKIFAMLLLRIKDQQ